MARILITSGPTRQYLDPVRYLTNASSGQMGAALAEAAILKGHEVTIVTGPVSISYPDNAKVVDIETTQELLDACNQLYPDCDGAIGAAAPCDYKPIRVSEEKIKKTGGPLLLELIETADVVASMGEQKRPDQWLVGFALETDDARFRALSKLQRKCCDLVVLNGPSAINAGENSIEMIDPEGNIILDVNGSKREVANQIVEILDQRFCPSQST